MKTTVTPGVDVSQMPIAEAHAVVAQLLSQAPKNPPESLQASAAYKAYYVGLTQTLQTHMAVMKAQNRKWSQRRGSTFADIQAEATELGAALK